MIYQKIFTQMKHRLQILLDFKQSATVGDRIQNRSNLDDFRH
jgi:hypothetical protein